METSRRGPEPQPRPRAGAAVRSGRDRARTVATRLGTGLREARQGAGLSQQELSAKAGISQSRESEMERGRGASATIETWACLAAAVGEQFVGFLERAPGATQPRDIEHLRRQSALIELATAGGWSAVPELAIDPGLARSRSIDVALVRPVTREAAVVEVWDWFDDVGASLRGLDAKVSAFRQRLVVDKRPSVTGSPLFSIDTSRTLDDDPLAELSEAESVPSWRIAGLFVVRDTLRNRRLVADLRPLFAARFDGSSAGWISALGSLTGAMPDNDGFVWSDGRFRLVSSRLRRARS